MEKASLQSLQIVAESIKKVYMDILKNGNTPENQENLNFLFEYENRLYQSLSFLDYEDYIKKLKKQNPKLSNISIIATCLGNYCFDASARVLERLSYLRDQKATFSEEFINDAEVFRFRYAHYLKFFVYLDAVYKQYRRERPFYKGLLVSYLNLIYTYNYMEKVEKDPNFSYDEETLQKFVGYSEEENDIVFKEIVLECLDDLEKERAIFEPNNNDYLAKLTFKMFIEANFLCLKDAKSQEEIIEKINTYLNRIYKTGEEINKDKIDFFHELGILLEVEKKTETRN